MPKFERQCQRCGLIDEMDYWTHPKRYICEYCSNEPKRTDNKAMIALKRMKQKLGTVGA
jgi:hypothetical protein